MRGTRTVVPAAGHGERDGFDRVTLAAGDLEAAFAPGAEMAATSLRHAGEDLLHRHGGLAAYAQRGGVMGIPIRHPGANRLAGFDYAVEGTAVRLPGGPPLGRCEEHGLPIHGLLGGSRIGACARWRGTAPAGRASPHARPGRPHGELICFEPMSAPTNVLPVATGCATSRPAARSRRSSGPASAWIDAVARPAIRAPHRHPR